MKTIIKDDRTEEQNRTHIWGVVARDSFMSNWGEAANGSSRCAWAVSDEDAKSNAIHKLFEWVKNRSEMKNVSIVNLSTYRVPRGTAHFHIYVAGSNHPAF